MILRTGNSRTTPLRTPRKGDANPFNPEHLGSHSAQGRCQAACAEVPQELLTTFKDEIGQLVLVPRTGGIFEIRADDDLLWSRRERGRFPELKELKQLIRDRIAPGKDLGHSDRRDS